MCCLPAVCAYFFVELVATCLFFRWWSQQTDRQKNSNFVILNVFLNREGLCRLKNRLARKYCSYRSLDLQRIVRVTIVTCVRWCSMPVAVMLLCMLLSCITKFSKGIQMLDSAVLPACCWCWCDVVIACIWLVKPTYQHTHRQASQVEALKLCKFEIRFAKTIVRYWR